MQAKPVNGGTSSTKVGRMPTKTIKEDGTTTGSRTIQFIVDNGESSAFNL